MGFRLARLAGIDVHVDWSLLVIFVLIATSLALSVFPAWHPDWGLLLSWTTALVAALLFFASILLHELSHALVGRRHGVVIRRITLFVFGGMAHIEREPGRWRAELWMAAVGPLTSLVLGIAFLAAAGYFTGPVEMDFGAPETVLRELPPLATLLFWLGQVNILLGLFNLVPGFPLDGGRVLRAILWAATGSLRTATRWAARAGQVFAWCLIAAGFLMMFGWRVPVFGAGGIGGLWLIFIGWFLYSAALMSYRQLITREALEGVPVSRLMLTRFETASPDMSVRALIEERLLGSGQHAFPVLDDGIRLLGIVSLQDVHRVPREARAMTTVGQIMTKAGRLLTIAPTADAHEAMVLMASQRLNQLPVVRQGRLLGLVRREDLIGWLALHEGGEAGLRLRELSS